MRCLFVLFVLFNLVSCRSNKIASVKTSCSKYYDNVLKMNVYKFVDEIPRYPTGDNEFFLFLLRNFKIQERIDGMRWTINVSFVVDVTGSIRDARIENKEIKDYSAIDIEAVRILNLMPKWKPARCKGKNVAYLYSIPLRMRPKY